MQGKNRMICIFDVETIPDVELVKTSFDITASSDYDISLEAFDLQEQKSGSSFLPITYHKSVAISAVICDEYGQFDRVNTIEGDTEEELLRKFLAFIDTKSPKLVSFNGRGFDLPMLMLRAMKYNLSCHAFYDNNSSHLNRTKWDNYRYRFNEKFHIDLMDSMSEFGAVRGLNLDTVCAMVGLPGKYDVHGDQVVDLYYNNEIEKIREYCESDVLNTYWLYLKYEILKGNLLLNDYFKILINFKDKLPKDKSYSIVFDTFIQKEIRRLEEC
jgi:predicted PolB exonuclease-like 3'-5' exonuclease